MKLIITATTSKVGQHGPTPHFEALAEALELNLDGTVIWGQNANSDKEWGVELTVEKVERA